jgi:hypothetical protein
VSKVTKLRSNRDLLPLSKLNNPRPISDLDRVFRCHQRLGTKLRG